MSSTTGPEARLVLEDGSAFPGVACGSEQTVTGEVVFTTGMTGYQEVLTDPSYCGQIVTMTAPQMGNVGINRDDRETERPFVSGFVVHEMARRSSNWRAEGELNEYLKEHAISAIAGVDTRALTRHIRSKGAMRAAIGTETRDILCDRARAAPKMEGQNLTDVVSTKEPFPWTEGSGSWGSAEPPPSKKFSVAAIDYGVKRNILRCLVDAGAEVTVVPASMSAKDVLGLGTDAVFLSNGPGDPAAVADGIQTVQSLLGKKPLFGICLGHQILSLALGCSSYKLKFGHRGLNQPVKDLKTQRVEITTQNHGFAIDIASLEGRCDLTHVHLNDGTCQGIHHRDSGAFSVQYHPEASAGPHDAMYLFGRFRDAVLSS
ncbi:MAG: glutamine-hydrolyzing carbamoyl-phosphate synthase small subunit [Myxococcota bacterium]